MGWGAVELAAHERADTLAEAWLLRWGGWIRGSASYSSWRRRRVHVGVLHGGGERVQDGIYRLIVAEWVGKSRSIVAGVTRWGVRLGGLAGGALVLLGDVQGNINEARVSAEEVGVHVWVQVRVGAVGLWRHCQGL